MDSHFESIEFGDKVDRWSGQLLQNVQFDEYSVIDGIDGRFLFLAFL